MGAWGNFTAREEHGTEQVEYSDTGINAQVTLRVPYNLRSAIVADLISNRRAWPKDVPGLVPLATTVGVMPVPTRYTTDAGQELIFYEEALLNVGYTTLELAQPTVDSIEPTAEFITLDYRCFRWGASNGVPISEDEAPGKLLRGFSYVRTFSDRVDKPHTDFATLVGSVNSAPVTSDQLGFTFGAETLLYCPPNISWSPKLDGTERFNSTVKFTFKPETWNKYWRAASQSWEFIHLAGDPNPYKSYPPNDLSNILSYGAV